MAHLTPSQYKMLNQGPVSLPLLIICFGDSLTAGYQSATREESAIRETPYGNFLQEWLGEKARISVSGVCGELTGEMAMRFRSDVIQRLPAAVVILGGTNDLGCQARPAEIFRNLLKMYELARAAGIGPIAVTVPSIRIDDATEQATAWQWAEEHIARRRELNGMIMEYCIRKALPCVDLFAETSEVETGWLAAEYSNDGLHLTTEGYRKLARLLYEQVFCRMEWRECRPKI